jgi:hypothetical protein
MPALDRFIVNSPQIEAKVRECESVLHQNVSGWFE